MAQPLHHEHIVRINDPANLAGAWLTREQLWAGLQYTVLAPELLDESIDSASIEEIGPADCAARSAADARATMTKSSWCRTSRCKSALTRPASSRAAY